MASSSSALRVTELANPLTHDIDVADLDGIVRLLGSSDAQLFTGHAGLPNLGSDDIVARCARVAQAVAAALRHPSGKVVFTGCGTSGRLAHLFARSLNAWMGRQFPGVARPNAFDYLLAGSDAALLLPQEQVEDQPHAGVDDLTAWEAELALPADAPVVLIGISCGLSATYVASMLSAALDKRNYTAVAMGFNPIPAVAHVRVDGWARSFHDVLVAMEAGTAAAQCVVVNPVAGPETIAGSSRMKGGSITKILTETICTAGVLLYQGALPAGDAVLSAFIRDSFLQYEVTVRHVYNHTREIAALVGKASAALNATAAYVEAPAPAFISPTGMGRIIYVGVGTAGVLGLVDASECNPTYGSLFNSIRGFIVDGFTTVAPRHPAEVGKLTVPMHMRGDKHAASAATPEMIGVDVDTFTREWLPTLLPQDVVVLVYLQEHALPGVDATAQLATAAAAVAAARAAGANTHYVAVVSEDTNSDSVASSQLRAVLASAAAEGVLVPLPSLRLVADMARTASSPRTLLDMSGAPSYLGEIAVKLVLNATTTGAHVRKGSIFHNRMINLMLTNAKLFHRACGIVADVTHAPAELARKCVLRAIYHRDDTTSSSGSSTRVEYSDADLALLATSGSGPAIAAQYAGQSFAELEALPVSTHVHNASSQLSVVPTAIMLAVDALVRGVTPASGMTELQARALLRHEPVIRRAITAALAGSSSSK